LKEDGPMNEKEKDQLDAIQEKIGYRFKDPGLLVRAMTHSSFAHEQAQILGRNSCGARDHYERLEFLGDAVLSLAVSHIMMERFPLASEGELSRIRAGLVNSERLAAIALETGLSKGLLLGKGEESTNGRAKPSILGAALESLLGAVYLDGGFGSAFDLVSSLFGPLMENLPETDLLGDYKTPLQEKAQARFRSTPSYRVVDEQGPDHMKTFEVEVFLNGKPCGRGRGRSKKEAEQDAARRALLSGIFDE